MDRTVLVITNGKITGATGNIGGELVKQLSVHKDRNVRVVAAHRKLRKLPVRVFDH